VFPPLLGDASVPRAKSDGLAVQEQNKTANPASTRNNDVPKLGGHFFGARHQCQGEMRTIRAILALFFNGGNARRRQCPKDPATQDLAKEGAWPAGRVYPC